LVKFYRAQRRYCDHSCTSRINNHLAIGLPCLIDTNVPVPTRDNVRVLPSCVLPASRIHPFCHHLIFWSARSHLHSFSGFSASSTCQEAMQHTRRIRSYILIYIVEAYLHTKYIVFVQCTYLTYLHTSKQCSPPALST
jgi:hypothetical protein